MAVSRHLQNSTLDEMHKNNVNFIPVFGPHERQFIGQWRKSGVHSDILKVFDEVNIVQMKPLHQNGLSYLMKNYNTVLIDYSKTQPISYLASILTSLINNYDNKNNIATGVQAVILSSSTESCDKLKMYTKTFISKAQVKINVVVSYETISGDKSIDDLYNGKGRTILITTPISLIHLLDIMKSFNWKHLRHFVFDELDILLKNFEDHMEFFSRILKEIKDVNPVQIISASVKWNRLINNYLNQLFVNWQYIFGSHLDAVNYMNIQFTIVEVDKENKIKLMLEYIMSRKVCRWILFTSNTEQSMSIYHYMLKHISCVEILIPGQMNSDIRFALTKWNAPLEYNHRLWICSDIRLYDFYIDNADCIIHFNVPLKKEIFSIRFSVFQDSSNTLIKKDRKAYMFFDDTEEKNEVDNCIKMLTEYGLDDIPILYNSININFKQAYDTEGDNPLTEEIASEDEEAVGPIIETENLDLSFIDITDVTDVTDVTDEFKPDVIDNATLWTKAFGELKIEAKEDTSIGESKKDDDTNKRDHDETDE